MRHGLQKHTQSRTFPPVVLSVRPSVYWSVRPYAQLPVTIWTEPLWPERGLEWGMEPASVAAIAAL